MNILEFENTQGITLRYSTASVFDRSIAYLIDLAIVGFVVGVLAIALGSSSSALLILVIAIPILFYSLLMEIFNDGKSLGKMALGLKVVRVDGQYPTGYDYFMRWIFRWVDIYMTSGALAALVISSSPRNQRVGDMLGDTTVIRTRKLRVPLQRILNLNKLSKYTPQYPQVIQLKESQVVLIKESLDQAAKYTNDSYTKLLDDLAIRVAKNLNVETSDTSRVFLQTIIKDYISLTR
ncbi:RDD family protein [Xanthomarina gelatinilytica]|uniref:RDD family protein n=1 Tax=Xanthomarina gelatinilytica TaxID=1137281 RepID=UPI003AA8C6EF